MTPTATVEQIVREVVRGERPWTDLRSLGMDVRPEKGKADNLRPVDVKIGIHDLARGFMAHSHDPAALRAWAFVMEALDADFDAVTAHPAGEHMWDAIWSASFGNPLEEAQLRLIEEIDRERQGTT
jgi:hypothetical protein